MILKLFYNREAVKKLRRLLQDFQPDVAHLHNIYHHLSPSIIDELKKQGIPMVMTLHDYKLICPNYNLFAHGEIWEKSKKSRYYRCFLDRCIKDSYAKSLVCTLEAYFHNFLGVYKKIDAFISPGRFLIDKFQEFGFNKRIYHLPNPILEQDISLTKEEECERYILYFGRLSQEKGVEDLIKAYSLFIKRTGKKDVKLKITGDGPQRKKLEKLAKEKGLQDKIVFTGFKEKKDLEEVIKNATVIVFPSGWYENYPYSVLEAQQAGKIVICSNIGGMGEMVKDGYNGFLYSAGNISELSALIENVVKQDRFLSDMGENAKQTVANRNDREAFYKELISIYDKILK
jgi:glycosyltransferase involved in cell wall biosynthesis